MFQREVKKIVSRVSRNSLQRQMKREFIRPAYELAKRIMPKISPTEAAALQAGTVGFDGQLFSGHTTVKNLTEKYDIKLSPEENRFMTNEVQQLCEMMDDYQLTRDRDMSPEVWDYLKSKKFFGMVIPKEYGGLGFTAHGHSQVVTKIASRSSSAAVTVMVPNSLGPGELLMRYGTKQQKDYFLPRLAVGDIIPCFGLTGPSSGSDAANMRDNGIVVNHNGELGIRASFKKRYITLAPIAGVVGLAFILKDPNGLLKGIGSEGITIALLERGHPGLRIGDRHDPLNAAFMNGTVEGDDVFIPMNCLLGGQERAGFGWNMLMECLSEGRGISLPALSVAATKRVVTSVGAYARIRKQFKVSIADMEGVQEGLARIGGHAYIMQSAQLLTNAMLNQHEQPAVISAIMKQQLTSRMRIVVNDGMDILGGAGICNGPANFLANSYNNIPIAITVEGANTLTRSLIQYGQGLTRAHPHLLKLMKAIQDGNDMKSFNTALYNIIGHAAINGGRSLSACLLRSRIRGNDPIAYYESQLQRLCANFAFCSDVSLTLGGKLKAAEFTSGRFADILSNLYLGYATLWFHKKYAVEGSEKVLDYAMQSILNDTEDAFFGVFANFPVPLMGNTMRMFTFPLGRTYTKPSDKLVQAVAMAITTPSKVRDQLAEGIFLSNNMEDRIGFIHKAFPKIFAADRLVTLLRKEKRSPTIEEKKLIDEAEAAREVIIQVDSFSRLGTEINQSADWNTGDRPAYHTKEVVMEKSA
eukprot:gene12399-26088_t